MSFLHAICGHDEAGYFARVGTVRLPLPEWKGRVVEERGYLGRPVLVGVRAEDVYVTQSDETVPGVMLADLDPVAASIDVLGSEMELHLGIGEEELVAYTRSYVPVKAGEAVPVKVAAEQLHVFDAETGTAIVH